MHIGRFETNICIHNHAGRFETTSCIQGMKFLVLCLVLFRLDVAVGPCSWPAPFASSTWRDSVKGNLEFTTTTTMAGWPVRVVVDINSGSEALVNNWTCLVASTFSEDGTLVMVTSTPVDPFQYNLYLYVCLKMTKVTDVSYRYYIHNRVESNANYDRILANAVNTVTDISVVCQDAFAATGSEYQLMIKLDSLESARLRCPYNFLGAYGYVHTAADGTETCSGGTGRWTTCTDHTHMAFDLAQCATNVAYSKSGTVWCVDTVPIAGDNYVTVYNINDTDGDIDNLNIYRFACFAVSSDGSTASVTPQSCKKDQTSDVIPRDNSAADIGATLTMTSRLESCPSCPVLAVPTNAMVTIETNGATTTATYTCSGGVVYGSETRTCQIDNTWTSTDPSCFPPDVPTAAASTGTSNTAVIIGGTIGGIGFLIILGIILAIVVFMKLKKRPRSVKPEKRIEEAIIVEATTTATSEKKLQAEEANKNAQATEREGKAFAKEEKKKEKEAQAMKKAQLKVEKKKEKEEQEMRQAQLKEEKKKEKSAQAMKKVQLKKEKTKEKAAQAMKKVQLEEEKKILNKEMAEKQMQSMKSETKNKTPTTDTKQEAANEANGGKTPPKDNDSPPSRRFAQWLQANPKEIPMTPPRDTTGGQTLQLFLAMETGRWEAPTDTALTQRSGTQSNSQRPSSGKGTTLTARDVYIENKSSVGTQYSIKTNTIQNIADGDQFGGNTNVLSGDILPQSIIDVDGSLSDNSSGTACDINCEHLPNEGHFPDTQPGNVTSSKSMSLSDEDGFVKIITRKRKGRETTKEEENVPNTVYLSEEKLRTHTEAYKTSLEYQEPLVNTGTFIISEMPNTTTEMLKKEIYSKETNDTNVQHLKHFNDGVEVAVKSDSDSADMDTDDRRNPSTTPRTNKVKEKFRRESTYTKSNGSHFTINTKDGSSYQFENETRINSRKSQRCKVNKGNTPTVPDNNAIVPRCFAKHEAMKEQMFFQIGHSAPPDPRSKLSTRQPTPYRQKRSKTLTDIQIPSNSKKVPFHSISSRQQGAKRTHGEALETQSQPNKSNSLTNSSYNKSGSFDNDNIPRISDKNTPKPNIPSLLTFKKTRINSKPVIIPCVHEDEDSFVGPPTQCVHTVKKRIVNHIGSPEVSTVMAELYGKTEHTSFDDTEESELVNLREYSQLSFYKN